MTVSKSRLNNRAFSLLELIIAVGVLSLGITVVLQALSYSGRVAGISGDMINAVFLGEDIMQDLEFKEKNNLINKEPAMVQDKLDKFTWQYTLEQDKDLTLLYRLGLDITWQRANRQESLSLNSYLRQ